ncbi:acylphosphatase [uncultured Jatrophihabitans sp.]|uniref:acylphosphatase n=1 Tax=uncultured Jatrophihabitans sp. TaxID=1610747 RepID=UPI0035CA297D
MADEARLTAMVSGDVQGVGFRDFVRRRAEPLGVRGRASNLSDGRVEVVAEGERAAVQQLVDALQGGDTPGSVRDVDVDWQPAEGMPDGFSAG